MVELIDLNITDELLRAIVGIFVIVDPIGSVGIFLSVTNGFTQIKKEKEQKERQKLISSSDKTIFFMLFTF